MPNEDSYKTMFFIGALWNWSVSLSFALGYKILFPLFGMVPPNYMVFFMMFLGLVFVYGIGYFWVSRDINKNHDIVRMGIIGKLIVFVAMLWAWVDGELPVILMGAGIVDLIFTILFIKFLSTHKQMETK